MRKTILFFFLLCCVSIVYSQSIYRDNALRYVGVEEIRRYNLYNKKDNPACNLKINFFYPMVFSDKQLENRLQSYFISSFFGTEYKDMSPEKAVKEYSKAYVEDYKKHFESTGLYKSDEEKAKEEGVGISEYEFFYSYDKTIRNTIMFNRGNIISQVVNVYEYMGGAHGASSTKGLVFDISSGKDITYDEIFYEGADSLVSKLLLSCLMEERRYTNEEAMIDAGFNSSNIPPSSNFVVNDKGITFIYNPYELGAYVLGIVEIFVPYTELFVYMKPDNTLFRWAENYFAGNRIKYETSYLNKEYFAYDPEKFPGFSSQIQFTYPKGYYDQGILDKLKKQFVINAFGEEYAAVKVSEIVNVFYDKLLADYESFVTSDKTKKFIAKELAGTNVEDESSQAFFMSLGKEFTMTNVFHLNQDDLISYETIMYTYDGGAHGLGTNQGFTIHLPTAKNLSYDDIFLIGSKNRVRELILDNLLTEKGFRNYSQLTEEGYELDLIVAQDNFYLDTEGVTFIYTPYEIGPYSLGTTKVKIPYNQLSEYLQSGFRK